MEDAEIYRKLADIFRDIFLRDDIELRPDLTAHDVAGWDSFKQIDIILAVESAFNVRLTTREIDGLNDVGALVRAIAGKIGSTR
jgi:acyl carrier protein